MRRGAKRSAFVAPLPAQWTSSKRKGWSKRLVRRRSTGEGGSAITVPSDARDGGHGADAPLPTLRRSATRALASVSLHNLLELPAEQPGQAEKPDQHHDAQARRGIVDGRLRELTERIAGRDNGAGPKAGSCEVERKECGPGQPRYSVGKPGKPANAMRETMKQDHPDIVTVRQANDGLHGAFEPRKTFEQAGAVAPTDPEANDVAGETADPADRNERTKIQRTRMRRITREQRQQQAMRGRIGKHEAVGRIAVLPYEVEERGQIRRKQQYKPTRSWNVPPKMSGFGLNASTPRKAAEADRQGLTAAGLARRSCLRVRRPVQRVRTRAHWSSPIGAA